MSADGNHFEKLQATPAGGSDDDGELMQGKSALRGMA
jgi:hypothetical protein